MIVQADMHAYDVRTITMGSPRAEREFTPSLLSYLEFTASNDAENQIFFPSPFFLCT